MGLAARINARTPVWIALLVALCAATGVAAGIQPKIGLEVALGLAFVVAVLANVTVGLVLFTILSFLDVINSGGAALSFMKIAGLLLFLSWVAAMSTQRERGARSLLSDHPGLVAALAALVGWSAISAAWAQSPAIAISSTERYLLNILLVPITFTAARHRTQFVWVVTGFVIGAVFSAVFGLLQSTGGRLAGTIGDPNEEAAVLVAGLMLAVGLAGGMPRGSPRRVWLTIGGVLVLIGLLTTVSRGGLLAAGCALLGGTLFGGRWRARAAVALLIGAAALGLYFTVLAPLSARQHLNSGNSTGRADLWKVAWGMFKAEPIKGFGSGNFQVASIRFVQDSGSLTRADLIVDDPHVAHNVYLELLADLGIPGLLAFVATAVASLTIAVRAADRFQAAGDVRFELLSRMLILAILGMLAADFFISDQFSKQLWLLLALPPALMAIALRSTTV